MEQKNPQQIDYFVYRRSQLVKSDQNFQTNRNINRYLAPSH
jgi:hypothetical protein